MSLVCSPSLFAEMIASRIRGLDSRAFVFPSAIELTHKNPQESGFFGVSFIPRKNTYTIDLGWLERRIRESLDVNHWKSIFQNTEIVASTAVRLKAYVVMRSPNARLRTLSQVLNDPETPLSVRKLLVEHPQISGLHQKLARAKMESSEIPLIIMYSLDIGIFQHFVHYGYIHGLGYTYTLSHILY